RAEFDGLLQLLPCVRAVADAGGPAWGVAIKHPQRTVWPGIIKSAIQFDRRFEVGLHLFYQLESAQRFGARQLAAVHPQVIVGRGGLGVEFERALAGRDALLSDGFPLLVVVREFCPIETGASKLPGGGGVIARLTGVGPSLVINALEVLRRR